MSCFLPKSERLNNSKYIQYLFRNGTKMYKNGFICLWTVIEKQHYNKDENNYQVMFSVSKKYHKKAVERNKIKRLMKETYRLNKKIFSNYVNNNDELLLISLMYAKKDIPTYQKTYDSIKNILSELSNTLNN